jgi:hypothetical protein
VIGGCPNAAARSNGLCDDCEQLKQHYEDEFALAQRAIAELDKKGAIL